MGRVTCSKESRIIKYDLNPDQPMFKKKNDGTNHPLSEIFNRYYHCKLG